MGFGKGVRVEYQTTKSTNMFCCKISKLHEASAVTVATE
jgi:hypothetical protein